MQQYVCMLSCITMIKHLTRVIMSDVLASPCPLWIISTMSSLCICSRYVIKISIDNDVFPDDIIQSVIKARPGFSSSISLSILAFLYSVYRMWEIVEEVNTLTHTHTQTQTHTHASMHTHPAQNDNNKHRQIFI